MDPAAVSTLELRVKKLMSDKELLEEEIEELRVSPLSEPGKKQW